MSIFYRIHPSDRDLDDLLDPEAKSSVWVGSVYRNCEECDGMGTIWVTERRQDYEVQCGGCDGNGTLDDSVRNGVSCVKTIEDLIDYFRGRSAHLDDCLLVKMEGEEIGEDWDAEYGACLIRPSKIIWAKPLPKKIRKAIED